MKSATRGRRGVPPLGPTDCDRKFVARTLPMLGKRFARFFRALADPTRLEIVCLLAAAESSLCACEIEERFDLSQPTLSHHLRVLREAGIVRTEKRGTWKYFELEPIALDGVWTEFLEYLAG